MANHPSVVFTPTDYDEILQFEGELVLFAQPGKGLLAPARTLKRAARDQVRRLLDSEQFETSDNGQVFVIAYPGGLAAHAIHIVKCDRKPTEEMLRKAGAALGSTALKHNLLVIADRIAVAPFAVGLALAAYRFDHYRSKSTDADTGVTIMCRDPERAQAAFAHREAAVSGTLLARDLVNEPANILTTDAFAARLLGLAEYGLSVTILDEAALAKIGMNALLGVGQGSPSPSAVAILEWNGGSGKPFAMIGKGVVFDSGGLSIKPAGGMEEMTMDMAGAAVVAGAMKALATRSAKANVVGLIGLVENMPDGKAQRPGDIVSSLQGDTIEVINTDAEGRLVLADLLRYAQDRFDPVGMCDFATLTGAIITCLGHEMAGLFSNSDALSAQLADAAQREEERVWRLPLDEAYDRLLKSRLADMKNVAGRPAGSITAAQFLQRFVDDGRPWAHFDIAGVARTSKCTAFAPPGATGWGVRMMDRFVETYLEAS